MGERSSDIVPKAILESKALRELAIDAAKREIIENITPGIRKLIDRELASHTLSEDQDRMNRHRDGYGETAFEEGTDKMADDENDLGLESIAGMFPSVNEEDEIDEGKDGDADDEAPACDESDIPTLGENDDMPEMDEEISISEAELDKVYKEALQIEMQMSKGFKETPQPDDEVDAGAGLHDVKSGERPWDQEEPPAKQNWTVSEVRKLFAAGLAENKKLRQMVAKLSKENRTVRESLNKVNLFNSKVLHVNKFFVEHAKLNDKQKRAVVEAFDAAASTSECKKTYKMLESTFRASGVVSEGRKPKASSQRPRSAGATERVIRESVDKGANGDGAMYARWQQLSGLTAKK